MKILCWNVNGIRTTVYSQGSAKGLLEYLQADIFCFQETKLLRDQLDEAIAFVPGYTSYFSFNRGRTGYSGVATYCKDSFTPVRVEEGLSDKWASNNPDKIGYYGNLSNFSKEELMELDSEGRAILTEHKTDLGRNIVVINVYCPRADPEKPERLTYKLRFYELLKERAEALLSAGKYVIIVGDINTSHKPIDHCEPDIKEMRNSQSCHWLDNFLVVLDSKGKIDLSFSSGKKFVDTFRYFYPCRKEAFTCWSTVTSARKNNYGTRIDYILADRDLVVTAFTESQIQPEIEGSDHCPIYATLQCHVTPAEKVPTLCTKSMSEFSKKQAKLTGFLKEKKSSDYTHAVGMTASEANDSSDGDIYNKAGLKPGCSRLVNDTTGPLKRTYSFPSGVNRKRKKSPNNRSSSLLNFFSATKQNEKAQGHTESVINDSIQSTSKDFSRCNDDSKDTNRSSVVTDVNKENSDVTESYSAKAEITKAWKSLLHGPLPAPLCTGHKLASVMRTVKKPGTNHGRQFYVCALPDGHRNNPKARCNFFQWVK